MSLFKYLPKENIYFLLGGLIYLTPPKYLNDETEFKLASPDYSTNDLNRMFDQCVEEDYEKSPVYKKIGYEKFKKIRESFRNSVIDSVTSPKFIEETPEYCQTHFSNIFGVISLTELGNDEELWNDYASAGSGLVIEFHSSQKFSNQRSINAKTTGLGIALQVSYNDRRPKLNKDFSNATHVICTKENKWSCEKEWRIVAKLKDLDVHTELVNGSTHYFLKVKFQDINKITLGDKMPLELQEKLKIAFGNLVINRSFDF